jgi:hypothetical protein
MTEKRGLTKTIRTLVSVGLAALLLLPAGVWAAGGKSGAKARIELKSAGGEAGGAGGEVAGELVAVRQDAVVVSLEGGESRTVDVADMARIQVHRRTKALTGGLIGAVASGAAGVLFSAGKSEPGDPFMNNLSEGLIVGGAAALLGGAIGVLIGGQFGGDKTYDLATMSGAEVEEMIAALRKMARVKDYR